MTGLATQKEDDSAHSSVGRFSIVNMKTMSLYESGESNGKISLNDLFLHKAKIDGITSNIDYEKMAYLICRGGWPSALKMNIEDGILISKNYIEMLVSSDISKIDGVSRNPELARTILKSYARQVSTIDSDKKLIDDVKANYSDISDTTIYDYINQLKKLFIIDEIDAWNPNIRSKTVIRTSPKKSLVDPSIATAVLECSPKELMLDFNTYGLLFENLVDRDLRFTLIVLVDTLIIIEIDMV